MKMKKNHVLNVADKQGYCVISSPHNLRKNRNLYNDLQFTTLQEIHRHKSLDSLHPWKNQEHLPAIKPTSPSVQPRNKQHIIKPSPLASRREEPHSHLPLISSGANNKRTLISVKSETNTDFASSLPTSLFDFRQPKAQEKARHKRTNRVNGIADEQETDCRYITRPYEGCCDKFEYFDNKYASIHIKRKGNCRPRHHKRRSSSASPSRNPFLDEFLRMNSVHRSSAPSTPSMSLKKQISFGNEKSKKNARRSAKSKKGKSSSATLHGTGHAESVQARMEKHVAFNTSLPVASPEFHRALKGIGTSRLQDSLDFSDSSSDGTASPVPHGCGGDNRQSNSRSVTFSGTSVKLYGGNVQEEMADEIGPLDDSFAPRKSILKNRRRSIDDLDVGTKSGLASYLESKMKEKNKNSKKQRDSASLLMKLKL